MTFTFKTLQSGNHMRIVVSGKINADDCIGSLKHVMSDPHSHHVSPALIDLRDATYEHRDKADVIDVARALETFHSMLKNNIAIVAMRSTLFYAEVFSAHVRAATNAGIKVFVDIAAAEAFCMNPDKTVSLCLSMRNVDHSPFE